MIYLDDIGIQMKTLLLVETEKHMFKALTFSIFTVIEFKPTVYIHLVSI